MGYLFYPHDDHRTIVAAQAYFLEYEFIREGGVGRMMALKEQSEISKEPIVQEQYTLTEPIMTQLPLPRSSRVYRLYERYGYLLQGGHNLYNLA